MRPFSAFWRSPPGAAQDSATYCYLAARYRSRTQGARSRAGTGGRGADLKTCAQRQRRCSSCLPSEARTRRRRADAPEATGRAKWRVRWSSGGRAVQRAVRTPAFPAESGVRRLWFDATSPGPFSGRVVRTSRAESRTTRRVPLRSGRQGARSAEDLDADLGGGLIQDGRVERAPGRRQRLGRGRIGDLAHERVEPGGRGDHQPVGLL